MLIALMDSLRGDLLTAGLPIRSWHGPGAVANTVFSQNGIRKVKGESPREVNRAAQYAYAGGRFELFKAGHYDGPVYEYDLNSAYPAAMVDLPNLATAKWEKVKEFEPGSFGVWFVDYRAWPSGHHDEFPIHDRWNDPQPLFCRMENGNVSYPPHVRGWYWTPEAALVDPSMVRHGWVCRDDGTRPFAFIHEMYAQSLEWKYSLNSAEKALKLALNSLYGKMAQRVGWTTENQQIPTWHQLEWAGFVTSQTRARLWDAIVTATDSIIAVETDALFTTRPLPNLPLGPLLGEWSEERFDSITYLQNGFYYATRGPEVIERYRGFDKGSVPYRKVLDYLSIMDRAKERNKQRVPSLSGLTTRFIGMGVGLHSTQAVWRSWNTDRRNVRIGGGGKRVHITRWCAPCANGLPWRYHLHDVSQTFENMLRRHRSQPHSLPWLDDQERELRAEDELARW